MNNQEKKRTALYYLLLLAFLVFFTWAFLEVVEALKENKVEAFDLAIIDEVQSWVTAGRTDLVVYITHLGSVKGIAGGTLLAALILFLKRKRDYALFIILTVAVGAGYFNHLLKELFKRQRPDVLPLIEQGGYSFPSGHSMGSFIFYGALAFILFQLLDKLSWKVTGALTALLFIFIIGLSRIYLGVHYPSDVVGGYAAGAAWLLFSMAAFHYYEYHMNKRFLKRSNQQKAT
ncbi:phosphatase PAP2 family protein [Bacillus aerolatus]|uniref:Phosphatase PAP2 family protein n=1 Tax=Bacillus aerolatus TaxID=2653354 RepID=A0A6I1FPD7_9BACI|nr:phosphatase PAP2 family protein [Bacillus aerolatus]KAB7709111.1 phosphatase PAP2 family protein [Bacillus aerolatus]